ncbi:hypothetical protein EYF80_066887 [Liparis tanakae]|uniref:Uncharacterized protein n=1 Tax=Liparis tanakae TaxID=230148 RepID=A0A4Z2E2N3_9TELE|nr:hypothetical protein EYF80_066887 [Liparis tanakae]
MAAQAEQAGAGAPWENALLFWVNRVSPGPVRATASSRRVLRLAHAACYG